jgi:predicted DNA-binding protein (UPF0251 family)
MADDTTTTPSVVSEPHSPSNDLREAVTLRDLLRDGYTVQEAGRELGISRSTAFRRLALIQEDVDRGIANLLVAKGLDFAEDWIKASQEAAKKGDHRPAKDALIHAKVIEPVGDSGARTGVTIVIGTPEQPIRVQTPIIDIEPQ